MEKEVRKAVEYLKAGKVILYPTDTIWGIGCDATNFKAVERVYQIKHREERKSMIILLDDMKKLEQYVEFVPEIAYDLISSINTPLTVIYPEAKNLAKNLIAEDNTIAIRIVREKFCNEMISMFGKPVVSTSANISGDNPPLTYGKVSEEIRKAVDYSVDYNRSVFRQTKPSTIIRMLKSGVFSIVRQ